MSHSTSFILHYILDILAQNGLRKNSALINNNATRLYTKLATRCQFRKNRQKKNSSHLNLDLDIRAGNVKEKRKKNGEKKGGGGKKRYKHKNCPGGGWNERCSPTCSFGMNNVASGTSG